MQKKQYTARQLLLFIVPSIIGIFLFIAPLPWGGGSLTIGVGYMATLFRDKFGAFLPTMMLVTIIVSAVLTTLASLTKPAFIKKHDFWNKLLIVKPFTLALRIIAAVFAVAFLTKFSQFGFEHVVDDVTGGVVVNDLFPVLATWFFFSGFFLPLLMEFGTMDYFGTLIRRVMRPLFKIPGRSAIDALASWIGSGPVGVVITDKQYQSGYYTAKEASIIAVCFSLVSLPFAVFIASFLKLTVNFVVFYGTICAASLIAALILPRIYPLNKKKNEYFGGVDVQIKEDVPPGRTINGWALEKAVERAEKAPKIGGLALSGFETVIDVYLSLMPIVLLLGTISLIVAERTPVFSFIAQPLVPLFDLMKVPDAAIAAQATFVGFADMFLPSIFVKNSAFEITRFIIGAMSFTQLIYLTETGATILRSKIPVNFKDLAIIFIERTIITLPIVVLIAHMVY